MNKMFAPLAAIVLLFGLSTSAQAHVPAGEVFGLWQWPTTHLPVLDAELSEWDVIPEELWLTHNNTVARTDNADAPQGLNQPADASNIAFRFAASWNDETERLYYVIDRFDDKWHLNDDIEIGMDADHSGGWFWSQEGQSDEEAQRTRARHAQITHYFFDGGVRLGEGDWNWLWMTNATWYKEPPYSDHAEGFEGTPTSGEEVSLQAEWWHVYWDDFNWEDPAGSVISDLQEDEIIHMSVHVKDQDGFWTEEQEDRTAAGYTFQEWGVANTCPETWGNSDCYADWLLLPVQEDLLPTAVEGDSWGNIKSSFKR